MTSVEFEWLRSMSNLNGWLSTFAWRVLFFFSLIKSFSVWTMLPSALLLTYIANIIVWNWANSLYVPNRVNCTIKRTASFFPFFLYPSKIMNYDFFFLQWIMFVTFSYYILSVQLSSRCDWLVGNWQGEREDTLSSQQISTESKMAAVFMANQARFRDFILCVFKIWCHNKILIHTSVRANIESGKNREMSRL